MDNQTREFFLVALPGLEDLVLAELKAWCPALEATAVHGGVTVHAPLETGLALNLVLKTPTRILLRVASFRCRDFPKLYNKTLSIPWREMVNPACELNVTASSRLSRVKIKSRIAEACADAWMEYRQSIGVKPDREKKLDLLVRFVNDECTLSLDTSGERLHKRGEKQLIGEAPLRETIAAALIQNVERSYDGEIGPVEIVDPMMGSGTFLLEAAIRDRVVSRRDFAFENFAVGEVHPPVLQKPGPPVAALIGFENDRKTYAAAQGNLNSNADKEKIHLHAVDFFTAEPLVETPRRRWLFANPPYGERLKIEEPLKEFYERLFEAAERVARPERACFLLPAKAVKGKFVLPWGWKVLEKRPFVNGGIPVVSFLFGRTN